MEHGPLVNFVMKDIGEGKVFWVSGYANPKLRSTPQTNIKPVKVTMYQNNTPPQHNTGIYAGDYKGKFFLAKTDKKKIIPATGSTWVYDTEEEAIEGYNASLEHVACLYQQRINTLMENKIGN